LRDNGSGCSVFRIVAKRAKRGNAGHVPNILTSPCRLGLPYGSTVGTGAGHYAQKPYCARVPDQNFTKLLSVNHANIAVKGVAYGPPKGMRVV
jgi:hypothetical protein